MNACVEALSRQRFMFAQIYANLVLAHDDTSDVNQRAFVSVMFALAQNRHKTYLPSTMAMMQTFANTAVTLAEVYQDGLTTQSPLGG